jgi:anti-sigma B factor antagonist
MTRQKEDAAGTGLESVHFAITDHGNVKVVRPEGDIDFHQIPSARKQLEGLIHAGHNRLVMNLANCQYVASTTVGMLLMKCNEAKGAGGDLKLAQVPKSVEKVIKLLGVSTIFNLYDTEKQAIAAFG